MAAANVCYSIYGLRCSEMLEIILITNDMNINKHCKTVCLKTTDHHRSPQT